MTITNWKKILLSLGNKYIRTLKLRKNIISRCPFKKYNSSSNNNHTFFGYYDKTPFSIDDKKILALTVNCKNNPLNIKKTYKATIGYFKINAPEKFYSIGKTSTWCWQQGCRLMWFPQDEKNFIIYNRLIDGNYGSVIQNINNKEIIKKFNFPIYDINHNGTFALTLNFSRLQRLRPGYGYTNIEDKTANNPCPDDDGIWICNLNKNKKELIINLKMLGEHESEESMNGAHHYINHLCLNPEGNRFLFFHLWMKDGKRYNRGITSDLDGKNFKILNNKGFVSHYCWKNNNEILIFSSINQKAKYYLYTDLSDKVQSVTDGILNKDGHPTYLNNKESIITDTYPSKYLREQSLILFDKNKLFNISKIFSPLNYAGEVRCDLHPRISRNNRFICIDVPFSKGRQIVVFDIKNLAIQQNLWVDSGKNS